MKQLIFKTRPPKLYLILVDLSVLQLGLALLLESDDDQGHEDVDEEKREDDEEDDIEDGHFDAEKRNGSLVLVSGCHRMLQHAKGKETNCK